MAGKPAAATAVDQVLNAGVMEMVANMQTPVPAETVATKVATTISSEVAAGGTSPIEPPTSNKSIRKTINTQGNNSGGILPPAVISPTSRSPTLPTITDVSTSSTASPTTGRSREPSGDAKNAANVELTFVPSIVTSNTGATASQSETPSESEAPFKVKRAMFKRSKTSHTLWGGKSASASFAAPEPRMTIGRLNFWGRSTSPTRGAKSKSPRIDEDDEEADAAARFNGRRTREESGSADYRTSRPLFRRSSYQVDIDISPVHTPYIPITINKPPQPVVPQVGISKRRCSLTLPYPCLYGSWQLASKLSNSGEIPMSSALPRTQRSSQAESPSAQSGSVEGPPMSPKTRQQKSGGFQSPTSPTRELCRQLTVSPNSSRRLSAHKEVNLFAQTLQRIPMKDFGAEVRASLDVAHFLEQAVLLLDITETSLQGVTDLMLEKLLSTATGVESSNRDGGDAIVEFIGSCDEARSVIFAHDTVPLLARTIQATCLTEGGVFDYDQSWICAVCNLPSLIRRKVAIARLKHPANMGSTCHEVRLFVLVLCPSKAKGTKNALETGRTFATIFADMDVRQKLLEAHSEDEFKKILLKHADDLASDQCSSDKRYMENHTGDIHPECDYQPEGTWCQFGRDVLDDLARRIPHYASDYKDGFADHKTIQKVVSTTFFLYFACILPAIAFGVLNDHNTGGKIDVKKVIVGQTVGGLLYAVFSGQPLMILLTTAPLAIYIKIIHSICDDFELDFFAMYCCVGIWNSFFLILYSLFGLSRLMRWSTRSTEEIFALFISVAFCVDAFRDVAKDFSHNYFSRACDPSNTTADTSSHHQVLSHIEHAVHKANQSDFAGVTPETPTRATMAAGMVLSTPKEWHAGNVTTEMPFSVPTTPSLDNLHGYHRPQDITCRRESSILFLLLMLGTLWLGVSLYNFNKTPYLQASKREALADYALPVSVLLLSFVGSFMFRDVPLERFKYDTEKVFKLARIDTLSTGAIFGAMGLGFMLSLLFFMDQNITSAMVNNPCNKLKKGPAYHLDLFVVAILNGFLSAFGLPWMHATIPHSPLHVRSLADVEERVDQGHVYEIIVKVRETRLTGMTSHILIGLSMLLLPYPLAYIPTAVLDGLFLYMAVTALNGNQMFERITLLFMEQAAYPPNHYIRRVPQRKIHQFTGFQVLQLMVMCMVGFSPWPYMKMIFPILLLLMLPIRHKVIPHLIDRKYLDALDGEHQ